MDAIGRACLCQTPAFNKDPEAPESLRGSTGALLRCEKVPDSEREGKAFSPPARSVSGDQGPRPGPLELELGPVGTGSLGGSSPQALLPETLAGARCARGAAGGDCLGRRWVDSFLPRRQREEDLGVEGRG